MSIVYKKSTGLTDATLHYCPGCGHGIVHKLVAESLTEMDAVGKAVCVAPVGCAVLAFKYFNMDAVQAPHGRAAAVATGLKRALPQNVIFTYQGDGDLAAIGTAETVHAAARGESIVIIFVNNAIYGMTGGQMAPTTVPGQVTQTSPYGRSTETAGYPLRVCEMLATLDGVAYAERVSVDTVAHIRKAKAAIKKAFANQVAGAGFSIVEILAQCPTNWGLTPVQSLDWLRKNMLPYFPLGVYKDVAAGGGR
jgi:2-oxoglutarate ferredoxin oxidoreductase subunit beta